MRYSIIGGSGGGGAGAPTQPSYTPGLFGLNPGPTSLPITGTNGIKAGTNTQVTAATTAAMERIDLGIFYAPTNQRTFCFDLFVGATKVVADMPLISANNSISGPKPLFLHIPSGSSVAFNAAANANAQAFSICPLGYTADVAEPVTVIEPIGPVGSGTTYTSTTGTLVKVPNGSATSGWVCINPGGATASAYKRLYPFVGPNGDYTGRGTLTGILELGYADNAGGTTNFVALNTQQLISFTSIFFYTLDLNSIPCSIPSGKYLFAQITLSGNANKTTGTTTDGEPFNVQLHGGRS